MYKIGWMYTQYNTICKKRHTKNGCVILNVSLLVASSMEFL